MSEAQPPLRSPVSDKPETEVVTKKSRFPIIKIKIKTLIWTLVVLLILGGAFYFKSLYMAAWVNGRPISRISVIKQLEKDSGKAVLDRMINERLLNDEIKAKKISVTSEDVDNRIKTIEDQIKSQGSTLEDELVNAGLTMDELKKQIKTQLELEKMLGDKTTVADTEVDEYIKANSVTVPAGQEEVYKAQIKEQIKQQKLGTESQVLLDDLKSKAKIKYFVTY